MRDSGEGEIRYRQLAALIPDAVSIHRDGMWVYANPAAVAMFGARSAADLLGTPVIERVHPDDRPAVAERIRRMLELGEEAPMIEERLLRLDGTEFWGEVQARPFDDDGSLSVLVVVRDVTARKQAERRSALLEAAVMQSDEPIMILDDRGFIVICNAAAARLYGRAPEALLGASVAELRGGRMGDDLYEEIVGAIRAGCSWQGEFRLEGANGARLVARRVSPVFDEHGRVTHQIVVDRDITEERERQAKMEHVQRLESLGVLAGGIAHDFNNLLAAIAGHASLARMKATPMDPLLPHLDAIEKTSQRAAELCRQMLAYAGKGQFVVRRIDLSELVGEMTRLLEVSLHKGVVMRYQLAENLPPVEADVAQLQQVVMNLVTNANEAIGERSGGITVSTGLVSADREYLATMHEEADGLSPGRYVWLEVSDTGCGMDEETQRRLFEPFFTTKFTGRGLGMSAIRGIVRGHGGAIKVYSEPGRGTTVKVLLPAVGGRAEPLGEPNDVARPASCAARVLVVDDEESVREVAAMILEEAGFEVATAADGREAVARFRESPDAWDCVVLDMTMPRMNGAEAFREMRRIRPDVRVLLCSGYDEQAATAQFAGKGLAGFLQKPFSPESLVRTVADLIG